MAIPPPKKIALPLETDVTYWRVAVDPLLHRVAAPSLQAALRADLSSAYQFASVLWIDEPTDDITVVQMTDDQIRDIAASWFNEYQEKRNAQN